jgi:hypothetical protein
MTGIPEGGIHVRGHGVHEIDQDRREGASERGVGVNDNDHASMGWVLMTTTMRKHPCESEQGTLFIYILTQLTVGRGIIHGARREEEGGSQSWERKSETIIPHRTATKANAVALSTSFEESKIWGPRPCFLHA